MFNVVANILTEAVASSGHIDFVSGVGITISSLYETTDMLSRVQ